MLRLKHALEPGRVRLAKIVDPESGEVLDEAVVTLYEAPHSYTTEDVVEIACHSSPVLLEAVLRGCVQAGARLAEPGEFTQRAFLSGRLDLTQAEAVHDLIEATTLHQARIAAAQLGGALSKIVAPIKRRLVELIAGLEAGVDFAEDDLDLMTEAEIAARIESVRDPLQALAATYDYGRIVREGFTLAIVGRPNAGKSSLFNRLLVRQRAIVTDQPGTTRDAISERMSIEGIPVELIDTAGLRTAPDGPEGEAERQGIERTNVAMAEADLVLHVVDGGALTKDIDEIVVAEARPYLRVLNKSDLLSAGVGAEASEGAIRTSALTGEGIEELKRAIVMALTQTATPPESAVLTNVRQHGAIMQAVDALEIAAVAAQDGLPHELLLLDLYGALDALDRLTGATSADEILNLIFSTFCIGK